MSTVNGILTPRVLHPLSVFLQHFENTPRGRSERFAWASRRKRIPPRRIPHRSQPAASLLQNAYSASSSFPPPSLRLPTPPLSSLSLLLKHRLPRLPLFASVCFCSARSLESARVFSAGLPGLGDGGDSLESATRWGDATRFAALRYGRDRVSDGTPDIKSDAIMRRRGRGRARQSSPVLPRARLFVEVTASLPSALLRDALFTSRRWSQPWKTP